MQEKYTQYNYTKPKKTQHHAPPTHTRLKSDVGRTSRTSVFEQNKATPTPLHLYIHFQTLSFIDAIFRVFIVFNSLIIPKIESFYLPDRQLQPLIPPPWFTVSHGDLTLPPTDLAFGFQSMFVNQSIGIIALFIHCFRNFSGYFTVSLISRRKKERKGRSTNLKLCIYLLCFIILFIKIQ